MGTFYSGPKPLQIFFNYGNYFLVELDSMNFHEGSTATGKISFTLNRNTPPISVFISIIGYEWVMWKKRVKSGKSSRLVTYQDHACCWNQKFKIMQANESFVPGQYSYPFSFQVPVGIPGTYAHGSGSQHSNRAECSCTYSLYAELCTDGPSGSDMIGRSLAPLVVMQQARTPYNYDMESKIQKGITTWCWANRGKLNIKSVFEKDVVRMDEWVHINFSIDNSDCKNGIEKIRAVLKRKLQLKTLNGLTTYRDQPMVSLPLPGCGAGEKLENKVVQFNLNEVMDTGTPANLSEALGEFAGKVQQTCNGSLINVSYELHIIVDMDGCMWYESNPFVYTPIEILAPERMIVFQAYSVPLPDYQGDPYQQQMPPPPYGAPQNSQMPIQGDPGQMSNPVPQKQEYQSSPVKQQTKVIQKQVDETPVDDQEESD